MKGASFEEEVNPPLYKGFSRHKGNPSHPTDLKSMAFEDVLVLDTLRNLGNMFGLGKLTATTPKLPKA